VAMQSQLLEVGADLHWRVQGSRAGSLTSRCLASCGVKGFYTIQLWAAKWGCWALLLFAGAGQQQLHL
jgi:hypothetical protein